MILYTCITLYLAIGVLFLIVFKNQGGRVDWLMLIVGLTIWPVGFILSVKTAYKKVKAQKRLMEAIRKK
jgi:hypothetical protein